MYPSDISAAVSSLYGKGRVVYFAAGFDAAYYLYAYPYQRLCMKHAIEWAANKKPPIAVEAPMCVHATRPFRRRTCGSSRRRR